MALFVLDMASFVLVCFAFCVVLFCFFAFAFERLVLPLLQLVLFWSAVDILSYMFRSGCRFAFGVVLFCFAFAFGRFVLPLLLLVLFWNTVDLLSYMIRSCCLVVECAYSVACACFDLPNPKMRFRRPKRDLTKKKCAP